MAVFKNELDVWHIGCTMNKKREGQKKLSHSGVSIYDGHWTVRREHFSVDTVGTRVP